MKTLLGYLAVLGFLAIGFNSSDAQTIDPRHFHGPDADLWDEYLALAELCELPCFWGLHLGESNKTEVMNFLLENDLTRFHERGMYADVPLETYIDFEGFGLDFTGRGSDYNHPDVSFSFSFDDSDMLNHIGISYAPYNWMPIEGDILALPLVLSQFEEIPIIKIWVGRNRYANEFDLNIIYPEQQIELKYEFNVNSNAYPYEFCFGRGQARHFAMGIHPELTSLNLPLTDYVPLYRDPYFYGVNERHFVSYFQIHPDGCFDMRPYRLQFFPRLER